MVIDSISNVFFQLRSRGEDLGSFCIKNIGNGQILAASLWDDKWMQEVPFKSRFIRSMPWRWIKAIQLALVYL